MKKFLFILLILLPFFVDAKETITIIYGFSASDNFANYGRTLAEESNRIQNKYNFVFDVKPGGGQTIAVNYVTNTKNTVFQTGSAYWVRPLFYPQESYDVYSLRTIMTQCEVPFGIASVRYPNWESVPQDRPLTIGTPGVGVVGELIAIEIQKRYPNLTLIPYKSTTESIVATVGGQVDFTIGFPADLERFNQSHSLQILGITGTNSSRYKLLSQQGFDKNLENMNSRSSIMVPVSWSKTKTIEIRSILIKAEQSQSVRNSYALDYCIPFQIPEKQLETWQNQQNAIWTQMVKRIRKD